jgi:hypothetical protein
VIVTVGVDTILLPVNNAQPEPPRQTGVTAAARNNLEISLDLQSVGKALSSCFGGLSAVGTTCAHGDNIAAEPAHSDLPFVFSNSALTLDGRGHPTGCSFWRTSLTMGSRGRLDLRRLYSVR